MQCDFDTIGTRSAAADIETALVIHDLFRAIGFSDFTIRLNNRMVLTGLLERLGLAGQSTAVLAGSRQARENRGGCRGRRDGVRGRRDAGAGAASAAALGNRRRQRRNAAAGRALVSGSKTGQAGVAKLRRCSTALWPPARPPTACGLIFDRPRTGLLHRHDLRDVSWTPCRASAASARAGVRQSGRAVHRAGVARHRGLAGARPAAGRDGRAGDDREGIHAGAGLHSLLRSGPVARISALAAAWRGRHRRRGLSRSEKLGQQLKYADRRGFRVALIAGGDEFQSGVCQVKDLANRRKQDVPLEPDGASIIAAVKGILGNGRRGRRLMTATDG